MSYGDGDVVVETERHAQLRNAVLTCAIFGPLTFAFLAVDNFYPLAAWSLFSEATPIGSTNPFPYYVLRGETGDGKVVDIPAIAITNALTDRNQSLVRSVISNAAFMIEFPHPENVQFLTREGVLPRAARIHELLRSWGISYNRRLPPDSPARLRAIQLAGYEWPRVAFSDYDRYQETWRVELSPPGLSPQGPARP